MADQQATFAINLEDGTSSVSETAAGALNKLRRTVESDTAAITALNKAMKNLQQGNVVNIAQFQALRAKLDAKKQSLAQAQSSYIALGGSLTNMKSKSGAAVSAFQDLQKNAAALPGPVGAVAARFQALSGMLAGGAIALGIAAIVVAMVALTAAAVAAGAALFKYGLAQADAGRSELLRIEGLTKMRNWYGIAAGNAQAMQSAIDKVSASSALGRDKIAAYSDQLYKMHLRGDNLTAALEAMAIKGAVQGDAAASHFAGWAAGAAMAGQSVKKLADDVKARLGGIAAAQMLSLDVQTRKFHESLSALFIGVNIDGALKAFASITALFSQSTASGRALKSVVQAIFKPMLSAVETLGPVVKRFFQGMVIGALLIGIGVLKARNALRDTFGQPKFFKDMDAMSVALKLGATAIGLVAVAFGAVGVAMLIALTPMVLIGAALFGIGMLAAKLIGLFVKLAVGAASLGKSIVLGIVDGIKGGAKWVIDTVSNLGGMVWGAFKKKLGIASPSKEFAKLGIAIPQGIESGVKSGTPSVRRSVTDMVSSPTIPDISTAEPGARGRGAGASQSIHVEIHSLTVQATGDQPSSIAADIKAELQRVLEGVAIEFGVQATVT
jgi:hypothetical protein